MYRKRSLIEIFNDKRIQRITQVIALCLFAFIAIQVAPLAVAETQCDVGRMGGFVFIDLDDDGMRGISEPILVGSQITAVTRTGKFIESTITGPSGRYMLNMEPTSGMSLSYKSPAGVEISKKVNSRTASHCTIDLPLTPAEAYALQN